MLVDAPAGVRRGRLLASRSLTPSEIDRMMAAQMTPADKRRQSDYIIDNDGDLAALERAAARCGRRSSRALDLARRSAYPPSRNHIGRARVSNVPENLLYTAEHEYVARTDDPAVVRVGITDYAQGELGDVVFVTCPRPATISLAPEPSAPSRRSRRCPSSTAPWPARSRRSTRRSKPIPRWSTATRTATAGWSSSDADPGELTGLLSPAAYRAHIGE